MNPSAPTGRPGAGPPAGVRFLFLACLERDQPQFRGIRRALEELGSRQHCCSLHWQGSALPLRRRRALSRVLVTGHGLENRAGFAPSPPATAGLAPTDLCLPASCRLYLMGCFQGHPDLRRTWARGTGLSEENVLGSCGETESALSTCLLLHLLEQGVQCLDRRFEAWLRANDALRPHFPRIRRSYSEHGGDPVRTLEELAGLVDGSETAEFVSVIQRHPEYLTGLDRESRREQTKKPPPCAGAF